jgi:hypothetical protein
MTDSAGLRDETLAPALDRLEKSVSNFLETHPKTLGLVLIVALIVITSPLAWFLAGRPNQAKDWSEVVKNVVESGAVLGALFAILKWVNQRQDRAGEVLLKLDDRFNAVDVVRGRSLIDDDEKYAKAVDSFKRAVAERRVYADFDALGRFYIVLYGLRSAKQVPDQTLSVCFRYWLAHYFHRDRKEFRTYIDTFYPTLSRWLREDCKAGCRFFRPDRLFADRTDLELIAECRRELGE